MIAFAMDSAINSGGNSSNKNHGRSARVSTGNRTGNKSGNIYDRLTPLDLQNQLDQPATQPETKRSYKSKIKNIPDNPRLYSEHLELFEAADWILYCNSDCSKAYHRLVERYTYIVNRTANKYVRNSLPYRSIVDASDIKADALLGLLDAIRSFDPARGWSFESFASMRVKGAIIDGLRTLQSFPRLISKIRRELKPLINTLSHELGRTPTNEQLIQRFPNAMIDDIPLETVLLHPLVSSNVFNQPLGINNSDKENEYDANMDVCLLKRAKNQYVQPWDRMQRDDLITRILGLLNNPKEKSVIFFYYFMGMTSPRIAKIMNLSLTSISTTKMSALLKIKIAVRKDSELLDQLKKYRVS